MVEHKDTTYTAEESTGMVSEPAAACSTATQFRYGEATGHHVSMTFDVPQTFDVESFRMQVLIYAQSIIHGRGTQHKRTLSDERLEAELQSLSSFDADKDVVTPTLTKEDYAHFMRVKKPMKGLSKWL